MARYAIQFGAVSFLQGLQTQLEAQITAAVKDTALLTQAAWRETILRTPGIWQPIRDRYAASVQVEFQPDSLGARIWSDDPAAEGIETGTGPRDLKQVLNTSLKTRVAGQGKHAGQRYLIIPFRHNTPDHAAHAPAMPQAVYHEVQDAATFEHSTVTRVSLRDNQIGAWDPRTRQPNRVPARRYAWGSRLRTADMANLDGHQKKRYDGLVSFRTSLPGAAQSSQFMTFRVMGEWSSGWIAPAKPGNYIVQGVAAVAQKALDSAVQKAIAS